MPKPQPWGPSRLDTFVNCPSQFNHKYNLKDVEDPQTEAQATGIETHAAFENRLNHLNQPLPRHLRQHEPFMQKLAAMDGVHYCERKVGINRDLQSCTWEDNRVWFKGVVDFLNLNIHKGLANVVDYKTGKPHQKFKQLSMYALHTFIAFPDIETVDARYYWTREPDVLTRRVWKRDETELLWAEIVGDLNQYADAYRTNIWQERPSGLCRGYCPVKTCKHWQPRRN